MQKSVLIINGSPKGEAGNCAILGKKVRRELSQNLLVKEIHLAQSISIKQLEIALKEANSFVFITGTYWDSWGSPLQKFLEDLTKTEGGDLWLGKPVAALVLMHSVGGKEVLTRLQGVLNNFGAVIPPMSGLVYSTVNQLALAHGESEMSADLWRLSDLEIVCHNLTQACLGTNKWKSWPVDSTNFETNWLEE